MAYLDVARCAALVPVRASEVTPFEDLRPGRRPRIRAIKNRFQNNQEKSARRRLRRLLRGTFDLEAKDTSKAGCVMESLALLRVAILVTDGFEQTALTEPRKALEEARAQTMIVSPNAGAIRAWRGSEWGDRFPVDLTIEQGIRTGFGALVLPGGLLNADKLRNIPRAIQFVKSFFDANKPVAAICHGPWMVIEAGAALGRRIASWPSLRADLKNAGAHWVDQEVAVDGQLVTSRKPEDIAAFNREMIKLFAAYAGAKSTNLRKQITPDELRRGISWRS